MSDFRNTFVPVLRTFEGPLRVYSYAQDDGNRGVHISHDVMGGLFLGEELARRLAQQIVSTLEEARSEREGA